MPNHSSNCSLTTSASPGETEGPSIEEVADQLLHGTVLTVLAAIGFVGRACRIFYIFFCFIARVVGTLSPHEGLKDLDYMPSTSMEIFY